MRRPFFASRGTCPEPRGRKLASKKKAVLDLGEIFVSQGESYPACDQNDSSDSETAEIPLLKKLLFHIRFMTVSRMSVSTQVKHCVIKLVLNYAPRIDSISTVLIS